MDRSSAVREVMSTDLVTLSPDDNVESAMRALVERGLSAAPVIDANREVVGVLSDADLIVQESKLHFPTLLSVLGASIELGHRRFDEELHKALGSTVAEVMESHPIVCDESDTVEQVATLMHDHDLALVPVVKAGKLVGVVTRTDVLRAILGSR